MKFGSVCSGIGAAELAWSRLGWECEFSAEVAPFPSAVLAHRFPEVPNLGDFTRIDTQSINVLVGGTPCQGFSVAGLRGGLADDRSNLALEFLRLARRARPDWLVWENVPGVLSTNGGRDFGTFLGGLEELGYGWAYRTLDAQYVRVDRFGRAVPQRRRRVFVVGYPGDWRPPAAVLFERESLRGHTPPRREAGQGVAGTLAPCAHPGGFNGQDASTGHLVSCTLPSSNGGVSNGHHPVIPVSIEGVVTTARTLTSHESRLDLESETFVAHTLRGEGFDASEDGTGRGTPLVAVPEVAETLTSHWHHSNGAKAGKNAGIMNAIAYRWAVRRLTPLECERLMGLPDDWTQVPYRGRPAADGPRYSAIGNSMAVNVMMWLGVRIGMVARQLAADGDDK